MCNLFIKIAVPAFLFLSLSARSQQASHTGPFAMDVPFVQDYCIKYLFEKENVTPVKVVSDRNGYIQLLTSAGLQRLRGGELLLPGTIVADRQDRQTSDKKISGISVYEDQLVYIDDKAVFSNAWAGKVFSKHGMPNARYFAGGKDFSFLVSDGQKIAYIKDSSRLWESAVSSDSIREIKYDETGGLFWVLGRKNLFSFSLADMKFKTVVKNRTLTCFEVTNGKVYGGTKEGYFILDIASGKEVAGLNGLLPWPDLTTIREINGNLWFGSARGAFMMKADNSFSYYASQRWLPSDDVIDIFPGPDNSVLVLTGEGLAKIFFKEMTLEEKALFYERQVRERHIRTGFNATVSGMTNGDVTTGSMEDSDNDGLWTSMYLAGQAFRYAVTGSDEALKNVSESLDALERLYTINSLAGFPSRSFERRGYKYDDKAWRRAPDREWDWKSTTSSDEAIGHIFACGVIAELIDQPELQKKSIRIIDTLMSHIVRNSFYMIDWNGEPSRWGRWNPEYVNARPVMVGDRKLNSSNIIGMLQTAYHFTGKEKYRKAAYYLINEHGYLENLMRPVGSIGMAPRETDQLSRELSDGWNHSDDEMYYCGYWGLFRYAFNDSLKLMYKRAILDHWQAERPEKEGLWNILTALTGAEDIDLEEAVWYLREYPLDLIDWSIVNSSREDIELTSPGFRGQTTSEVLPPDELRISRHNSNRFDLDGKGGGRSEYSAGDIWLLPYWAGRYLQVIGEPEK
jgi:hypothetical protein